VGVAADVKVQGARADTRAETFIPYWQFTERGTVVILRTPPGTDPVQLARPLRKAVSSIDRNVPVYAVTTLAERVRESIDLPRFLAVLAGVFGGLALVLAAIGLYGVMAYAVSQRTTEIGVRVALGASRTEMFRLVLADGLRLTLAGIVIGLVGSLAVGRWLATLLFEVRPGDPATLVGMTVVLLLVAVAACIAPARRATRADPLVALRAE
jgi:ABC-type antimicrobial peptide transport system permease subunit